MVTSIVTKRSGGNISFNQIKACMSPNLMKLSQVFSCINFEKKIWTDSFKTPHCDPLKVFAQNQSYTSSEFRNFNTLRLFQAIFNLEEKTFSNGKFIHKT